MATTLYRKYRPQNWAGVTNQNHIKVTLQNEIETGKVTHAYLFSGPRGVGKTTTARILAKAVNCEKRKEGKSEPCDKCDSCKEIIESRSLDIIEIDAASHTGVDNVRENVIASSRIPPTRRKYKVFIIDEVHMLSIAAFNALLKTLEEPPAHVIFILATTEIHKVPSTIISRCQRFDFKKINRNEIVERLRFIVKQEKLDVDSKVLENIARHSEGCVRDAESLLGQVLSLGDKKISQEQAELVIPKSDFNLVLEFVEYLFHKDSHQAIDSLNSMVEGGVDITVFTQDLIEFLRKILLVKISDSLLDEFSFELDESLEKKILSLADEIDLRWLLSAINLFIDKKQGLKHSEIIQLPLELAVIELCVGELIPTAGARASRQPIKAEAGAVKPASPMPKDSKQTGAGAVSLAEVENRWKEVLTAVRQYNSSIVSILKVGRPVEVSQDILVLGFRYKFHQERIKDNKNRDILEKALKKIFNKEIKVQARLMTAEEAAKFGNGLGENGSNNGGSGEATVDILEAFGGKVVE